MNNKLIVMRRLIWLVPAFIFWGIPIKAQVVFEAGADARQVPIGEIFEVKFTLKNAQGTGFRPPSFVDFNVVGGPNRMNSVTMINGNATSSETYSYVLQGKREGTYTVGSASINVNGKTLNTPPLSIAVIKGKKQTLSENLSTNKNAVFIRAEVSKTEAHVGEQIILDYKLYTRVDLNGMNLLHEPSYDGFYHLEVNDYPHGENSITINGKKYLTRILRRVSLFVLKEGEASIEPMSVQVGVVKGRNDDPFFDPFFSSIKTENQTIQSNSLKIKVKSLPANAPISFTGGVGHFSVNMSISKTEATTDDAISLIIVVSGNGDAKRWQAPKMTLVEGLEIYDPKVLREESIESQGEWLTTKEFEYLIIPKKAGNYILNPEFSYLELDGQSGYKNVTNRFDLKIVQGKSATAITSVDKPTDIRNIKTSTVFINPHQTFGQSTLFIALALLPFLFFAGVLAYKQILASKSMVEVQVQKSRDARKIAEKRLSVATDFMKKGDNKAFYEEVSKTLFTYVSDKLGIPLSSFSKSTVIEKLQSLKVRDTHIEQFVRVLQECEIALFAGRHTEGGMIEVFQNALNVIVAIENDLKETI